MECWSIGFRISLHYSSTPSLRVRFVRQHHAIEPQQFSHRPGLKRAAARCVRRIGVGDFRHVAEAGVAQVLYERREEARTGLAFCAGGIVVHPHPGFDERSDQSRPYRALMVRPVALARAAAVMGHVARILRREGA